MGGYWLGGEVALFSVALGLPLLVGICGNWKVKNEPKHEAIAPNFEKKAHDKQVLQAPTSLLTNSGFAIDGSNNARPDALFETMFQPQISNHTGEISGFAISKLKSFDLSKINLNAAEAYGYNNLHSEPSIGSILSDAMRALRSWETTLSIDCGVEIELSEIDFSEVHLVDKICWELDRLSVTPEGVAFSVATKETSHLVALEALLRLSSFGCGIDVKLEEATSEISVLAQKLPLRRLKLGGSLIAGVDKDANRQRRINDILTLSEQLSVETIAV
ncbi:MAG: EAL domain-containing protein, partial [Pseudomonadota bacterium]